MGIKKIKTPLETLDIGVLHVTNMSLGCWGEPVFTTSFDFLWWEVNGHWRKSLLGFSRDRCTYGYYTETTLNFLGFKYTILRTKQDEDTNL